jgi:hypothetical protein
MIFLDEADCINWCQQRHFALPSKTRAGGLDFRIPSDAGARVTLCKGLWTVAGEPHRKKLVWVFEWGVWGSQEHMPLFDRFRSAIGETRPLIEIRGHLTESEADEEDGLSVMIVSALFLWDCWVYSETGTIIYLSHDEFGTVFEPVGQWTGTREWLKGLDVLRSSE